jgi:hypothetical protein
MCIFLQGQLEQTISESFTRAANLRAFVYKANQCPPAILKCQSIFRRLIDPRARNTLTSDMMSFASEQPEVAIWNPMATSKVPSRLQTILRQHNSNARADRAQFLTNITIHGLRYTTSRKSFGNSCVLLGLPSSDVRVPAVIDSILKIQTSIDTVEIVFVIRRYKALQNPCNGSSRFQDVGLSIWSSELGDLEIVKSGSITSHYASLSFKTAGLGPVIAVISLARVSPPVRPDEDSDILDITISLNHLSF